MSSSSIPAPGNTGRIIRAQHGRDFLIVSNATLRDKRLSLDSRGLLCYLLSHPDDWYVCPKSLAKEFGKDRKTIDRMLLEMESAGYYSKTQHGIPGTGKFYYKTVVYETPRGCVAHPVPSDAHPTPSVKFVPIPYPEPVTEQEEDRGIDSLLEFVEANGL